MELKINLENFDQTSLTLGDEVLRIIESGKSAKVVITQWRESRTEPQRKTMWMWYREVAQQIKEKGKGDYTPDDLHEYFKDEFCPVKQIKFGGKVKHVKSTTRLNTGEMHFYLQQIDVWSANAGFKLTIPVNCEYQALIERQNK